jgi:hypothetical protein
MVAKNSFLGSQAIPVWVTHRKINWDGVIKPFKYSAFMNFKIKNCRRFLKKNKSKKYFQRSSQPSLCENLQDTVSRK